MIVYVKYHSINYIIIIHFRCFNPFIAHELRTPGRQEATLRRPAVPSHAVPGSPALRPGREEISRKLGEKGDLTMI